ncbi:MAG TPA: class D sortase [Candidatus Angelobacter sp.]
MGKRRASWLRFIERCLLTCGFVLLGFYVLARIHGVVTLHAALRTFEEERSAVEGKGNAGAKRLPSGDSLHTDTSLWSEQRIKAYRNSLSRRSDPLAVLKIPKLRLEAPVLEGIDDLTLNSGVGRIPGTAFPGQFGNIGIAGHRDGFFRGLKDIAKGDTIELVTLRRTDIYVVDKIYITQPKDVSVLRSGPRQELTLVTCYPFYYLGSAPQRYIVQASLKQQAKPIAGQ